MSTQLESPPDQLMKVVETMPDDELDQFVKKVMTHRAKRKAPHLAARESELLLKINEGLPENLWRRYEALLDKRDAFALTEAEYAELLALTSQVEEADVARLRCLIDLAELRGVSLDEVMDQLGVRAPNR